MKNIKIILISMMLILIPIISLGATGHINGCTSTSFDTSCCTKTFKITPRAGYTVIDVIINGISKGPLTSYTFTNITGPQTLKVVTQAIGGTGTGGTGGEAIPEEGKYKVQFNANGGTGSMPSQMFDEGTTGKLNACTYTKQHYHFMGWALTPEGAVEYTDEYEYYSATEDRILYAVWEKNVYRVTFDANGGIGNMTQDFTYGVEQNLTTNTFTKSGYTFLGWSTNSGATTATYTDGQSYSAISNVTLYAVWKLDTYTITYDLKGGTVTGNPATYTVHDSDITLINPTRSGCTFAGWTGSNGTTASTTVTIPTGSTGNVTYTANWTCTVTINNIGDVGTTWSTQYCRVTVNGTTYSRKATVQAVADSEVVFMAYGSAPSITLNGTRVASASADWCSYRLNITKPVTVEVSKTGESSYTSYRISITN